MAAQVHTQCSPSGFSRWSVCTASPNAIALAKAKSVIPDESSSKYADEGTVAHALQAMALDLSVSPREFIGEKIFVEELEDEFLIEADMAEEVDRCYEYIQDFLTPKSQMWVEKKLPLDKVTPGEKGTADVSILAIENGKLVLHVMDLKYGRGIPVIVENNGQIQLYALGAFDNLLTYEQRVKLDRIVIHVLQPRLNNIVSWTISKGDIERFRVKAHSAHSDTQSPERRKFVPGEHCRFCEFQSRCQKLKDSVYSWVLEDQEDIGFDSLRNPESLTNEELAKLYPMLDFIGAWVTNTKNYCRDQATRGVQFQGLKLVAGQKGKRAWKDEKQAKEFMESHLLTDEECYEQVLLTPAKAEKTIGRKNINKDSFKAVCNQSEAKAMLVKDDDPRPDYQMASDDELFESDD